MYDILAICIVVIFFISVGIYVLYLKNAYVKKKFEDIAWKLFGKKDPQNQSDYALI
tara:strand:- start:325 stop:492 length:168 start_codon:yes stop_codon:yes gene_type:complete